MEQKDNFKYKVYDEFIYFEFFEEADFEIAKKEADFIKEIMVKKDKSKIISKLSYASFPLKHHEDYALVKYYQEIELDQVLHKAAMVVKKADMKILDFWLTAVNNRFMKVKLFENFEEARKWILE